MSKTVTRYAITHINKSGMRTLIHANQRRHFFDTKEEAQQYMMAVIGNNSKGTLESVYGDTGKMEVRPVECLVMKDGREGDATNVWFDK